MPGAQTISLMSFGRIGQTHAEVALGHVGYREFRRAMLARYPDWDPSSYRYEYAVFRDDESIVFNVRPDETGAKPVTVTYFGNPVEQV